MRFEKEQFSEAIRLWTDWNGKINVISRKDIDNLYEHHILHSLAIAEYIDRIPTSSLPLPDSDASEVSPSILDVGCGGGFPGIPLAMVMPRVEFTLCDSIGKKITGAKAVAEGLGLKNIHCVNARAESLPGQYDWVVSRAVTSLDNFYPWVKGKFRKGILYLKGGDVNEEIASLCRKCQVCPSDVTAWPVSDWLDEDYFAEKFVIHIRK